MKIWQIASLMVGAAGLVWRAPQPPKPLAIVVSGDQKGYLAPCGCSDPMIGGIKRRASAIRSVSETSQAVIVDNGGLVAGIKRQDEIKAEAMAEALAMMNVDAINLGVDEASLGKEMLASLQRLSGNKFISTHFASPAPLGLKPYVSKGGYLIGGVCMQTQTLSKALSTKALTVDQAVTKLVAESAKKKLKPFLLLRGSEDDARALAKKNPRLAAIVFSGAGDPLSEPITVGKTILLTPGENGKYLVTLKQSAGGKLAYRSAPLSPEYRDDPTVSATYFAYLGRVKDERLLDQWPRVETEKFAGSEACGKCHRKVYAVYKETAHAKALESLEKVGHDFDPDCVSCHVVDLSSKEGFTSREKTPQLAQVGCESCHGPQAAHAASPHSKRPSRPKVQCTSCHDTGHSTKFDYDAYWAKIAHG